jgi:6-phosphogluconolactonase
VSAAALHVLDDPAAACAERLVAAAAAGGDVVLTGGSTPRAAYERAAAAGADWSRATVWFGDERCVAPGDERSNYALAHEALLRRLSTPPAAVHRMEGERGPEAGAELYAGALRDRFSAGPPVFDLLLLGLGPDGHCASLFPGKPAVAERARWVVGVPEAGLEPYVPRITLTLPALVAAREIVFLVAGEEKAEAVVRAFGPGRRPTPEVPASLVEPVGGTLTVLLDAAAARELKGAAAAARAPGGRDARG